MTNQDQKPRQGQGGQVMQGQTEQGQGEHARQGQSGAGQGPTGQDQTGQGGAGQGQTGQGGSSQGQSSSSPSSLGGRGEIDPDDAERLQDARRVASGGTENGSTASDVAGGRSGTRQQGGGSQGQGMGDDNR